MRLRLEDLDGPRCEARWAEEVLRDLEWLGLDWDGPHTLQSQGMSRLKAAVDQLVRAGLTYPCICSRADIRHAQSAPQQGVSEIRYPGTCKDRFTSVEQAERISGRPAALRFRVPPGPVEWVDGFCGQARVDVHRDVGDFVVAKRDHAPAYQLAVVVDDAAEGITEVHRGADLLPSAARQLHVRQALKLPPATGYHFPLVLDEAGRRIAKRQEDLSLAELRCGGTDPRAIVGWVARTAGIDAAERLHPREALGVFRMDQVPRSPVVLTAQSVRSLREAR